MIAYLQAADHIFKVHIEKKTKYLPDDQAQKIHHTVSQMLFKSARS